MKLELLNHKPKVHVINIIKCGETTNRSYHPPSQKNIPLVSYLGMQKSVLSRVGWRDIWGGVRRER